MDDQPLFAYYVYAETAASTAQLCGVVLARDRNSAHAAACKLVRRQRQQLRNRAKATWPKTWAQVFPELRQAVRKKDVWIQLLTAEDLAVADGCAVTVRPEGSLEWAREQKVP